jgi:glyoxylate/hydroxypyruvate reductase A
MSNFVRGRILVSVTGWDPSQWVRLLAGDHEVVSEPNGPADPTVEYAVVWKHPHGSLKQFPNLKAIFSLGAGVDHILTDPALPDVPVARIVQENLTRHMVEYVTWRVMDHHRQGSTYRAQQAEKVWYEPNQPTTAEVSVGIMGLGELGRAAATTLLSLGFTVNGWKRTPKSLDGVNCFAGKDGLRDFLAATDILVVLLPHTPATEGIIDYELLRGLRRDNALGGASLINAGRGKLQKEADILRALEDGTLKEASLDVFEVEPLPENSPLWNHPRVFITPHAAASSDPRHLGPLILEQIARFERGEPLLHLVDISAGY